MRASISKPTPFIYLAFGKKDPFIYLIIQNVDLFIYCPFIFCAHLLLFVRQISQSVHWIPKEQALRKISEWKICAYTRMSEKWGLSHRNPEKSGHSYTFCWKNEANHIPGSAEKGGIRHAHPYYAIYRKLPARSPQPPPPPHTHTRVSHSKLIIFDRLRSFFTGHVRQRPWVEDHIGQKYVGLNVRR